MRSTFQLMFLIFMFLFMFFIRSNSLLWPDIMDQQQIVGTLLLSFDELIHTFRHSIYRNEENRTSKKVAHFILALELRLLHFSYSLNY